MTQNPIAVSTWSLHRLLENMPLAALPVELAARGYDRVEICHFHLDSRDPSYLQSIGASFRENGVIVQTLLIDDGDITNPETRQRDIAWIKQWIDAAAVLGAEKARVIAGKALPTNEALALSVEGLTVLAAHGAAQGVRVVTENWFDLLSTPDAVHHVLDGVGPQLGFMADTGNWHGATKYDDLARIFARAELCHAKAQFSAGQVIDATDFSKCLEAAKQANYAGPMTLIFDAEGDEWDGLAITRDFVRRA